MAHIQGVSGGGGEPSTEALRPPYDANVLYAWKCNRIVAGKIPADVGGIDLTCPNADIEAVTGPIYRGTACLASKAQVLGARTESLPPGGTYPLALPVGDISIEHIIRYDATYFNSAGLAGTFLWDVILDAGATNNVVSRINTDVYTQTGYSVQHAGSWVHQRFTMQAGPSNNPFITCDVPHHRMITWSGGSLRMYWDGVEVTGVSGLNARTMTAFLLGISVQPGTYVADVRVSNVARLVGYAREATRLMRQM